MRRLQRAAGLLALAPTLAMSRAPSLVSTEIASFSLATVVLDLGQEAPARELALDVRVDPAKEICGPGRIEINGHVIETKHWEIGKADLKTKDGVSFAASWKVECETVDDEPAWQSIDFRIDSYDGNTIDDAYFVASLRQVEPVNIADFDGTLISVSREGTVVEEFEEVDEILDDVDPASAVEAAKARLEELRRLQELREKEIAELEMFVVEGTEAIGEIAEACGGKLKCLARSFLRKLTGAASRVYDKMAGIEDEDFSRPHHPKHGNHSHHHHGNHTHGNHTWPHPPHKRPHWLPPFCRCPPRRPHKPHPPPGEPPHHGPPSPPPKTGDTENIIAPDMPESERPFVFDIDGAPPPPLFHVPEPPQPPFVIPTPLKIFGILFVFFSVCGMIHRRRRYGGSCAERRRRRRARREAWRQRREERRAAIQRRKEEVRAFFCQLFQRVSRGFSGDEEKQSPFVHTVVQPRPRAPSNASNTSSNVSTTMEQDLARFREAASMVTDMVAAEEGRARQRAEQRRMWAAPPPHPPPPMSPGSAFPDYVPQDEFPPAYETDLDSGEDLMVADGFRYTPGSSEYTPSTGSDHSSSDELGYRKP